MVSEHEQNRLKTRRSPELNRLKSQALCLVGQRPGIAIDQETSEGKVEEFVPSRAPFSPNIRARIGDITIS